MIIHEHVGADPGRVAVRDVGGAITYADLDAVANKLANRLVARGARAGQVTALRLPRTRLLPAGILGALRAGTAYLPLNPEHPAARQRDLMRAAGAAHLVTTAELALDTDAAPVFVADTAAEPATPPAVRVLPDNLAYVLPTSGTTGVPKLVAISHRSAMNTFAGVCPDWGLGPGDVVLQVADVGYSAAVRDLLAPLVTGAMVELLPATGAQAVQDIAGRISAGGVTCLLSCLPQVLAGLLDLGAPASDLRLVMVISEALTVHLARRTRRAWGPGVRLCHQYGLTECAMTAMIGEVPANLAGLSRIPHGRVIGGASVYTLDSRLRPVPEGTVGEIYVGGTGLARGYHGQPALTASHFVADPFAPGGRLYRTGDLGRFLPGGGLEYLGRSDRQVKVRGHRIELDEIELALRAHPGLRAAAVRAHRRDGEAYLVGYLVPGAGGAPRREELTEHLATTLPRPYTELRYVVLPELPTLPNGKIDHHALPEPAPGDAGEELSGVEGVVGRVWRSVLGQPSLARDEDVFSYGAHSVDVVRVTARLRGHAPWLRVTDVFRHPTVASLAAFLGREVRTVTRDAAPAASLSPAQRALWFVDRLRSGSSAYSITFALDVPGGVDRDRLRRAVERVAGRHSALRTTFGEAGGEPHAVVARLPRFGFTVAEVDERDWSARPFDLAAGPLLRAAVRPDGTRAWFAMHHTVADGWSVRVFLDDLSAAYNGNPLPDSDMPPPAHADPPREWLERLRTVPHVLPVPADRPRPAVQGDRGGAVWRDLPAELVTGMRALGVTPFMVVMAAWAVLLSRLSGQDGLLIGAVCAGRDDPAAERVVGMYANTVPVPIMIDPAEGFGQLVSRVGQEVMTALDQAAVPFHRLVELLAPERAATHTPLVQVACDWTEEDPPEWRFGDAVARRRDLESATAKFDLWLSIRRQGDTVRARLEYRDDLFTAEAAERLADRFLAVVRSGIGAPGRAVRDLDIMPTAEREVVMLAAERMPGMSAARETSAGPLSVLDMVRGHDGVAVRHAGVELTYAELHERSDRLARRLRGLGAGADDLVALCLPRTPDLIVAMLGALKAGSAYLPLDLAYPEQRLADTLSRGRPVAVITDRQLAVPPGTRVLGVRAPDTPGVELPAPHPASLAYLMFTSGSTGLPKGVGVTHEGMAAFVDWARHAFGGELDCVAAGTSICFDLSVFEIFMPLSAGGTVELLDSGLDLAAGPQADRITLLNTVPAVLTSLLEDPPRFPALRRITIGGEGFHQDLVARLATAWPGRPITNVYGPTETTVYAGAADCAPGEPVRIGWPIRGARIHVLDRYLHPAPIGAVGEIYLGGPGLARGYHGQSALTADRFVADPFTSGARLYRTGDLGCRHPDGAVEYLGRTDRQIKIRGYRVEPAEVETVLQHHPAVRRALVGRDHDRLVGWVVLDTGATAADLREYLAARLPGYLVPTVICVIDAVPLTSNGKVNWAALPPPGQEISDPAPLTLTEKALADVWSDLLGVAAPARDSHFFELGGHSITATRLISRTNEMLDLDLPVSLVFTAPRLGDFARAVEEEVLLREP